MRLAGKVALITGGASGFGRGMVERFAAEGAAVMLVDLNDNAAASVVKGVAAQGGRAAFTRADVTKSAEVAAMIAQTLERFGRLDILVNNAGISHHNKSLMEVEEAEFDRIYAVNVKAIYLSTRAVVPVMRRQGGGVILNTSSTAGARPRPGLTWYNGSKGAVNTLTKSMAVELAPDKIRVNALCPVIGETALTETFMGMADTPENRKKFLATIPLGRFSKPEDVANAALYLASDEAAFITGACLEVDGGRSV